MEPNRDQQSICFWIAVLLFAVPATADQLIFSGPEAWECGGICAVEPIPGATPAPLIPNLIANMAEVQGWHDEDWDRIIKHDLSPDGTTLAFISFGWSPNGSTDIWTVNLDGTDLRLLVHQERYYERFDKYGNFEFWEIYPPAFYGVSWSPDGRELVYIDLYEDLSKFGGLNFLIPEVKTSPDSLSDYERNYVHSTPSGHVRMGGDSVEWHPDGRIFRGSLGRLYSRTRDDLRPDRRKHFETPADLSLSSISADGKIAFYTYPDSSIFVMESVSSDPVYIARGCCAAWSPDGQRLAYFADGYLRVMNADGSGQRDIYPIEKKCCTPHPAVDLDWIGEPEMTTVRRKSWGVIKQDHANE